MKMFEWEMGLELALPMAKLQALVWLLSVT
jgi:hypothetical protein